MDMYAQLYLKWITDKVLLYSAWNSAQCYVAAWMRREFRGEWIHVYVWLSPLLSTWNYHNIVNWLYCCCFSVAKSCPTLRPHGLYSPTGFSAQRDFSRQKYWSGLPFPSPGVKHLLLGRKATTNLDSVFKKARHHFAYKGSSSQSYGFSSSHVWTWELDHKEDWALKNWCFQTVMLGRLLRMPWTARSNQSV